MASLGSLLSDEQFQCSICLDIFTNPSSTPCGHTFCMGCINRYWDGAKVYECPLCKKAFQRRPELQVNRTLREITEQFKSMSVLGSGGAGYGGTTVMRGGRGGWVVGDEDGEEEGGAGGGEGLMRDDRKRRPRALGKFDSDPQDIGIPILVSMSSLNSPLATSMPTEIPLPTMSNSHTSSQLAPPAPSRGSGRRRFTLSLVGDTQRLPICQTHGRGLTVYCKSDGGVVCPECHTPGAEHHGHDTVSLETEWMDTKARMDMLQQQLQAMITHRIRKMEQIKTSVTELQMAMERETAGSLSMFSALASALEQAQAEVMEAMEVQRRATEHHAENMLRQLELEVSALKSREQDLSQLSQSDDHVHCIQSFPALSCPPPTRDWFAVSLNSDHGTGAIYKRLAALLGKFQEQLNHFADTGIHRSVVEPGPVRSQPKVKRVQEYAVNVTLDSSTAHPRLVLSDNLKKVKCGDRLQPLPDGPARFDRVVCVLGRETFSSGRHYWEVEVAGKSDWDLGVASESCNRKGKIEVNPSNGYWFLSLRDKKKCTFRNEPCTDVQLTHTPHKIGIFLDYEKGQVSFYNVSAKIHIYTFTDNFKENLHPFFSPCTNRSGKNNEPLVITALPACSHTKM
ncbi:E3 ubiquitin-protein ligase TRIM7 isoform X2 [Gadus macrocephalus]|uniref:E3 ubiquitin-protein ligase TRIM7 isoform X2 n=1 Tax=Gadus macrocephalus TaxID=80720 RepID=UPI0028CB2D7E|nr:E3 ubiquitin-protein ligase TRIM7 isoform X2 [Gadus macrocephalus]